MCYQDDKADVILKYMPDEARLLKAYGELPENTRLNEGIAGGLDEEDDGGVDDYIEFEDEDIDKIWSFYQLHNFSLYIWTMVFTLKYLIEENFLCNVYVLEFMKEILSFLDVFYLLKHFFGSFWSMWFSFFLSICAKTDSL